MVQKKKKTTIYDIARHTGVSYQTVSRVINNNGSVAPETRKRVLEAMRELDFIPSTIARTLTTNRSRTLELITVDLAHGGHFADSIQNMVRAAREADYDLLITMVEAKALSQTLERAAARMVDGVVMYAPTLRISDEELLTICDGMPLVRRDYVPGSRLAWVGFDQVYATHMATEFLIQLGHRQIAAVPPALDLINGEWRYAAWKEMMLKHDLNPALSCPASYSFHSGYEAMKQILSSSQAFTAVLAGSDTIALGVLRALREHHLRVPQDVSVISFDNSELSTFTEPLLTTVDFSFAQQDTQAVKYLIELLHYPTMELHRRILLPKLIVRESTCEIGTAARGDTRMYTVQTPEIEHSAQEIASEAPHPSR